MTVMQFGEIGIWELIGHLSLSIMIGAETVFVIGGSIWAILSFAGFGDLARAVALGVGAAAGLAAAVWIYRLAHRQRVALRLEQKAQAGKGEQS